MNEEERESEEVDVEPFEGAPDFVDSPTIQFQGDEDVPFQDDEEAGDA